jgi:PPOX class probable F420-dependent enzyme
MIDESTDFGARVARHLREDPVVWLTTVTASGHPAPNPVWFLWEEPDTVLVFSLNGAVRERNLRENPNVSLNFAGDGRGGDIVVLNGTAELLDHGLATDNPAYVEKYRAMISRIGMDPDGFAHRYSQPVRITLKRVRGR